MFCKLSFAFNCYGLNFKLSTEDFEVLMNLQLAILLLE